MSMPRVFLISSLKPEPKYLLYPNAGLGYIAQAMSNCGIRYDTLDMRLGYSLSFLMKKMKAFEPDLIGISMRTSEYKKQYKIISRLKQNFPKAKFVLGGDHVNLMRMDTLLQCKDADYAVVFEGENIFIELLQKDNDIQNIKGLIFREDGNVKYNGDAEFERDLDNFSFPRYENFQLDAYLNKEIGIVSSRGCPYRCIFCVESSKNTRRIYRARSPISVVDEIEHWYSKGYRKFDFSEPMFNLHKARVIGICEEIGRRNIKGLNLAARTGVRADKLDKDALEKMKEAGFTAISFGVEGGNDKMLEIIKKSEKMYDIERAIKDACDIGFDVMLTFLIGLPFEEEKDVRDAIKLSYKYPINAVFFNNVVPIPGSELYDWIKKNDYFLESPEEYLSANWRKKQNTPLFHTPELNALKRRKLLRETKTVKRD
ncbi:B12-binding domain-containing radical SAM protein, partial [bacterium]|nr:B12-binding domain-containing radical SAM protein [bacterium]